MKNDILFLILGLVIGSFAAIVTYLIFKNAGVFP